MLPNLENSQLLYFEMLPSSHFETLIGHVLDLLIFLSYLYFLFFLYLFLAVLGLCCCARAFSSCSKQGLFFVVVCRLLIAVASLVVEHGL